MIASDEVDLNKRQNDLAAFEVQSDWLNKKAALDAADTALSLAKSNLNQALATQQSLIDTISQTKALIAQLTTDLATAKSQLTQAKGDLVALQPTLDQYNLEVAPYLQTQRSLTAQLNSISKNYDSLLPR